MLSTDWEASSWQLGGTTTPPDHPVNFPEELPVEDRVPVWKDFPAQILTQKHDRRQISSTPEPPNNPLYARPHGILHIIIVVLVVGAISVSLVVLWLYIRRRNRKRGEGYPGYQLHRGMEGQRGNGGTGNGNVVVEGGRGVRGGGGGVVLPVAQGHAVVEAFATERVSVPAQAQPMTQDSPTEHYAPVARDSAAAQAPVVTGTDPLPKVSYG